MSPISSSPSVIEWHCRSYSHNDSNILVSCVLCPGQPPLLATAQSPQPSTSVPASGSGSQIVTAIYAPSPSVTMATGVVSMTAVPPSVVYSVSSPSSASPHILPKHTGSPATLTHPHPDRQADRHLPVDRPADRQTDRLAERQTELLIHSDRQLERQTQTSSSSSSSVAPPSGSAVSVRPCSPQLQIQTLGAATCIVFITTSYKLKTKFVICKFFSVSQAVHQAHPN